MAALRPSDRRLRAAANLCRHDAIAKGVQADARNLKRFSKKIH
jgi:hypothetical protein